MWVWMDVDNISACYIESINRKTKVLLETELLIKAYSQI